MSKRVAAGRREGFFKRLVEGVAVAVAKDDGVVEGRLEVGEEGVFRVERVVKRRKRKVSCIVGYAMSSVEFISLHEGLNEDERCQKTSYMLQFVWRDLSSDFDVVSPYFNCPSTMETQFLHSIVVRTMLAFCTLCLFSPLRWCKFQSQST